MVMHNAPHPGEILLEMYLKPLGMSLIEYARLLEDDFADSILLLDKGGKIDHQMAQILSKTFNTSEKFWVNLQKQYDLSIETTKNA